MNRHAGIAATLLLGVVTACSAGTGSLVNSHAGPDDGTPGGGFEPSGPGTDPAGGAGDPAGGNVDNPGGGSGGTTCLSCDGAYSCTESDSSKPSTIALAPGDNGCVVVTDSKDVTDALTCDHKFNVISQGNVVATGTWSGNDSSFTITADINGQTLVATCTRTGPSSSYDAGTPVQTGGSGDAG